MTATVAVDTTGPTSSSGNLIAGTHTGKEYIRRHGRRGCGQLQLCGVLPREQTTPSVKLALAGTIGAGSSVYGSALAAGAANLSNVAAGDDVTATTLVNTTGNTSTSGNLKAGSYTGIEYVSALSGADAANYSYAGVVGNYTVSKLDLTGTIVAGSSVYGSALAAGAANLTNKIAGDAVTATTSVNTTGNTSTGGKLKAGSYTGIEYVSALGGADAANYTYGSVVGDYSVSKLALACSIGAGSSVYGSALAPGAASLTNKIAGDVVTTTATVNTGAVSSSGNFVAGSLHGPGVPQAPLAGADAANYSFAGFTSGANYTISQLALAGTIGAGSSVYGSALVTGSANLTNVVGTDAVTATTLVNATGNTSTSGNLKAGSYTGIEYVSALSGADAANYSYGSVVGNYTVSKLDLAGAIVAGNSVYGSALAAGAANLTNKIAGDAVTATTSVNTTGNTSTGGKLKAGSYTGIEYVSALGGADAANYTYGNVVGDYSVSKLALACSIATGSSVYGSALAPGAASLTNKIAGDVVTTTATVNTGAVSSSGNFVAGSYTQTAGAIAGADAGNYSFAGFTSGANYTINKLALAGTIGAGSSVYGSALVTGSVNLTNVVGTDAVTATTLVNTTGNTSTSGNLKAGSYTGIEYVSALSGADAANYSYGSVVGNYTVSKLDLAGAIVAGNSVYGSALAAGAANLTNKIAGDAVTATTSVNTTGNTSTGGKLKAGSYTGIEYVSALGGADAANYTYGNVVGDYSVSKLALACSIATGSSVYGSALAPGAASLTNKIAGDVVTTTSTVNTGAVSTSGNFVAGSYTQTAGAIAGADAGNYSFAGFTSGANYTINKLALAGTIGAGSSVYGSALVTGSANLTNVVGTDAVTATTLVNTTGNTSTSGNLKAGSYTGIEYVSALSGADAANYSYGSVVGNYTVSKLDLAGAIVAGNSVYGSALAAGAANLTNKIAGDAVTATTSVNTTGNTSTGGKLKAGSYTGIEYVSALGGADAANYTYGNVVGDYSVSKLALACSIATGSSVYGSALAPGAASLTNKIAGDVVTTTATVNTGAVSSSGNFVAGSYTQTAGAIAGADAGNYSFAGFTSGANYTINKLALAGTIGAGSSVYGSALVTGSVNLTNVVGTDAVTATTLVNATGNTSTSGNLKAGSYTGIEYVSALSGADAANYSYGSVVGNYTVSKLDLAGAIVAGNSVYGSALAAGAANLTNKIAGDAVTATTSVNTTGNTSTGGKLKAGSYTGIEYVSALGGADAANYTYGNVVGDYSVSKLALACSIATGSSVYGSALAPGAASLTNKIAGDVVTTTATVNTGAVSSSGNFVAGSYTQTAGAIAGADAGNYSFAGFTSGANYTISKLALTGASISASGSIYASAVNPGGVSFGNVSAGDMVVSTAGVNTGAVSSSGNVVAGSYTQTAGAIAGADADNYSFAGFTSGANYTISKLALTGASISASGSIYASALNPGAVSFGNVSAGDMVVSTAGVNTGAVSSSGNFVAGSYTQTAGAIAGADAGNYSFAGFTSGENYTISKLALTGASISASGSIYASALNPGGVSFGNVSAGDIVVSTAGVNTGAVSSSGNAVAGSYTQTAGAIAGADAGNYSFAGFTSGANYTISKLALTGTSISASGSIYASALNPGGVSFGNVAAGDMVVSTAGVNTGAVSSSGNAVAGSYTQNAGAIAGADAGNYSFAGFTSGANYTISQLVLAGTIGAGSSVYGSVLAPGAANLTNKISGDAVTATVVVDTTGLTSTSGNLKAGSYTGIEYISALGGADAGNYSYGSVVGDYSVSQLALTGTIGARSSVYGSALVAGAASLTNKIAGDVVTATTSVNTTGLTSTSGNLVAGTHTGKEYISALSGADAANYSYGSVVGNYTVSKLDLTGTIGAGSSVYGSALAPGAANLTNKISGDAVTTTVVVDPTGFTSTSGNLKAGSYTGIEYISALGGADAANYTYGSVVGDYSVSQLALACSIGAGNSVYGSALAPGTVSLTNKIAGDAVTTTATVNTGASSSSGNAVAGSYTQTAGTIAGADAGNYSFTGFTSGANYTISKLALAGASISASGSIYASALNPGAVSFGNVAAGDIVVSTAGVNTGAVSSSGNFVAGTYTQTAGVIAGADAGNYSFAGFTSGENYTISKLALTGASISASGSIYASALNPGAVSFGNVSAGDIVASTAGVNTGAVSSSGNFVAGSYTQTAGAIAGADAGNYSFAGFTSGANYTIGKLALTGTIGAGSSVYGSALAPGTASLTNKIAGDAVTTTATVNTGAVSSSGNFVAGSYTQTAGAIAGADAGNYSFAGFTSGANYIIGKLALTGTIGTGSSVYGSALAAGAANLTNKITGDAVTATVAVDTTGLTSSSGNLIAGTHTGKEYISALGGADAGNYSYASVVGDYSVSQLALAGTIGAGSSVYGTVLAAGAASLTNKISGDAVTATVAVDTTGLTSSSGNLIAGTHTGKEYISALGGADAANYTYGSVVGDYSVSQLALACSIGAGSSVYGSALAPGTASLTNKIVGDAVTTTATVNTGPPAAAGTLLPGPIPRPQAPLPGRMRATTALRDLRREQTTSSANWP